MPKHKSFTFIALPHVVVNHHDFLSLSGNAVKLLIDIASQFNGFNNGDLCAVFSLMKKRGWKSKSTLLRATKELIESEFLILTKQGGRKIPTLYAMSWKPIDFCDDKLDVPATKTAPRTFNDRLDKLKKSINFKQQN